MEDSGLGLPTTTTTTTNTANSQHRPVSAASASMYKGLYDSSEDESVVNGGNVAAVDVADNNVSSSYHQAKLHNNNNNQSNNTNGANNMNKVNCFVVVFSAFQKKIQNIKSARP